MIGETSMSLVCGRSRPGRRMTEYHVVRHAKETEKYKYMNKHLSVKLPRCQHRDDTRRVNTLRTKKRFIELSEIHF